MVKRMIKWYDKKLSLWGVVSNGLDTVEILEN